jgi:hypothetical protein
MLSVDERIAQMGIVNILSSKTVTSLVLVKLFDFKDHINSQEQTQVEIQSQDKRHSPQKPQRNPTGAIIFICNYPMFD